MQLNASSQYLANAGGFTRTIHPPGANPILGSGVIFNPSRSDLPLTNGPYQGCPVFERSVATPSPKATPLPVVVQGKKIDATGALFSDPNAIIIAYGSGSTCGPTLTQQNSGLSGCGGSVNPYVARAHIYGHKYIRLGARKAVGTDVLLSICSNVDGPYGCAEHPAGSFCRPKQSFTKISPISVYLPPSAPSFIDAQWQYVPQGSVSVPTCDKGGLPQRAYQSNLSLGTRLGDVNHDGSISVTDGVLALRCAAELSLCSLASADINCDQQVTLTDGVNILRMATELPVDVSCEPDRSGDGRCESSETSASCPLDCSAVTPLGVSGNWTLTWHDEFEGSGIPDPAKLGYETGFVRNHEAQYFTLDQVRVGNGELAITADRIALPNQYSTRRIFRDRLRRRTIQPSLVRADSSSRGFCME